MSTLLHACTLQSIMALDQDQQEPDLNDPEAAMSLLENRATDGGENSAASGSEESREEDWRQKLV